MFLLEEPPCLSVSTHNSHLNLPTLAVAYFFLLPLLGKVQLCIFRQNNRHRGDVLCLRGKACHTHNFLERQACQPTAAGLTVSSEEASTLTSSKG